jgi:PAS domain S-box-containing protein
MPVVLHVDDNETNRYLIRRMLGDASYEVVEADTGEGGLRKAAVGPDLVILDLNLPDIGGLEVCRRLRADPATAGLPVMHLTATYGAREMWALALAAGADAYLTYPIEPPVLLGTVRSLLRARAAEQAQRVAEAEYRSLFENALVGICRSTPDGRLLRANQAAARIFGYASAEEMLSSVRSTFDLHLDPAVREAHRARVDREGASAFDVVMRRRDGTSVWVSSSARAVRGASGDVVYYDSALKDVTGARAAEAALRESEARWRAHFKAGPAPAVLWRRVRDDFVLSDYNHAVQAATAKAGGSVAGFVGGTARALYADVPELVAAMEHCYSERTTFSHRLHMPGRISGTLRTLDMSYAFVPPDTVLVHYDDVTERLRMEEALRESERQFRAIFDGARDAIVIVDDDGRYVEVNPAACVLYGLTRDEAVGRHAHRLYVGDDGRDVLDVLGGDGHAEGEADVRRSDGSARNVEFSATANVLAGRHLLVMKDITGRKQAERALEESRHRLEALFANALDGILLSDDEGHCVEANPAAGGMLGYTRDELLALTISDLSAEAMRETLDAASAAFHRDGQLSGEWTLRRKDGAPCLVEFKSVANVQPGIHMAALRDVTDRREGAERLQRSQRQLAEAQQIAHVGSFERDLQTGAILASDEMFRIHGVEPGGFPATYDEFLCRIHPDDRDLVRELNQAADREGRPLSFEARLVRPDGSIRVIQVRAEHILDAGGRPWRLVGIVQDITERKQADELRRALLEQVLRVQEDERRNLARELHDEVGQALTALKLMLGARPSSGKGRRTAIRDEAGAIVDDLLTRIRDLSLDLRPPMLDDFGLMPALTWHLDRYRARTGIQVRLEAEGIEDRFPGEAETAAFRVVQEALTNVARHAGVKEATVQVGSDAATLRVAVSDAGGGFDAASVLPTVIGGLAGVRERVRLVGGQVDIVSSVGGGTRVDARIPIARAGPPGARSGAARARTS